MAIGELIDETTGEIMPISEQMLRGEIDVQIQTAKKYPRSVKRFRQTAEELATLDEETASSCFYAVPRAGKTIEGPSARLAEIVAHSWGNCRAGSRVVSEEGGFIVAQGVFHDLEANVAITYEVRRRITDKLGRVYSDDMKVVAGNAACSIALRNAVFKGIPQSFWKPAYLAARRTAIGDAKTLVNKRAECFGYFAKLGVTQDQIIAVLGVPGVDDIGLDELATLKGIATAIKDGDTTIEEAFRPQKAERPAPMTAAELIGDTYNAVQASDPDTETEPPADEQGEVVEPSPTIDGKSPEEWMRDELLQKYGSGQFQTAKERALRGATMANGIGSLTQLRKMDDWLQANGKPR